MTSKKLSLLELDQLEWEIGAMVSDSKSFKGMIPYVKTNLTVSDASGDSRQITFNQTVPEFQQLAKQFYDMKETLESFSE
ncbi:putative Histone-lysine N-methyltransferase SMYD3 [Monocercomonoides exilis]|uniref:putative Histone-lysine N-methyltransferase SMYD3 n=1 Tax=Monocercomonoides exilis TaxID=2049356 RepID=UPI00355A52A1|nr:putative Histone-lysine N-methyltransferase SMYD3 [Monocercomonoides exilis]|eukprot:MONOS_11530.1-p1 / transcript=MONOS_11530.1 / gene=MONOS_11530 / organism=Monocercomonoides_exilis_PA203 / gene_product=Histone-lysine N-methyltransferase SMYD3 / transcript_product=Histone-lysine N-methyltransferase SMYD3 / location=Mono_scaffold00583:15278-15688(+) / protein_length=80 / sequence_SO=supercontig / SO=protein_coding / is_pseudo=false